MANIAVFGFYTDDIYIVWRQPGHLWSSSLILTTRFWIIRLLKRKPHSSFMRISSPTAPVGEPDFVALWQHVAEQYMAAFLAGAMSFPGTRRIRAVFPTAMSGSGGDRLFRVYLAYYELSWRAFPDAVLFFDRLAAHTLGILSNGHTSQQAKKLEILGIVARFTVVVTSEAVGVAKPDPRIFTWACHAVAAHPTQCVYVGDRLETDARAAHQAGWIGVWLNRTGPEMGPPDVITIPIWVICHA